MQMQIRKWSSFKKGWTALIYSISYTVESQLSGYGVIQIPHLFNNVFLPLQPQAPSARPLHIENLGYVNYI